MLVNGTIIDASVNYSDVQKDPSVKIEYSTADSNFMELVKTVALSTGATFSYSPAEEDIDNVLNKEYGISLKTLTTFDKLEGEVKEVAETKFNITQLREKAK